MTDESAAQPFTASDAEAISLTLPALVAALQTGEKEAATTALIADGQDLVEECQAVRHDGVAAANDTTDAKASSTPPDCPATAPAATPAY